MKNFSITAGDTVPVYVTITDQAGGLMNLNGATARWAASVGTPRRFSSTPVLTKETGSGIALTNPALGELRIDLDPQDTAALVGDHYHELQITDSSGNVTTPLVGIMTVTKQLVGAV